MRRAAVVSAWWMVVVAVGAACGTSQEGGSGGPLPKGVAWRFHAGGAITARPTVAGADLVVASSAGRIHMIGRKDGAPRWSYDTAGDGPGAFERPPLVTEDAVLAATVGKGSGHLYALEASNGKLRWKQTLGADPNGQAGAAAAPVRLGDRVLVVGLDGTLLCLDLRSGARVWEAHEVEPAVRPAANDSHVFVASGATKVRALDAATGQQAWESELMAVVTTSLMVRGEELFAGTSPFRMFRLNVHTGEILKKMALQGKPVHDPVSAGEAVSVFLRDAQGSTEAQTVIALDAGLTRILWGRKAPEEWTSVAPMIWRDVILAGDKSGELFAYTQSDGAKKWSFKFDQGLGAIGASDDALYVGTLKGDVYAFTPPTPAS